MSLKRRNGLGGPLCAIHEAPNAAAAPFLNQTSSRQANVASVSKKGSPIDIRLAAADEEEEGAKRCRMEDGSHSPTSGSGSNYHNRRIARIAAEVAGHVEMVALLHSLPRCDMKLNEHTELGLLELNVLLKQNKKCCAAVKLKSSHSWSRARTQNIVAQVSSTVREDPAMTLVRHLVDTTYPRCSAAAAAKHVFEAPPWLQSWCERFRVDVNNVSILELTLYDAVGRVSNPIFFVLGGDGDCYYEKYPQRMVIEDAPRTPGEGEEVAR